MSETGNLNGAGYGDLPLSKLLKASFVLLLTLLVTGCNSQESNYARNGIGADLYSKDIAQATDNLETYLGYICRQADIPTVANPDGYPQCRYPSVNSRDWLILVHTGFNDIDRRCDGYLAWLEEVRQRGPFISSQITQLGRLTNLAKVAYRSSATDAIGLVAEAFGYTQTLFQDYQKLIGLGIEDSTIKTIVTGRRTAYRNAFTNSNIGNKPNAVHVLRSYLRICMPYTITMDVNTYARSLITSGLPPNFEEPSNVAASLVNTTPLPGNARVNIRRDRPQRVTEASWSGVQSEQVIDRPTAIAIQKALCFPSSQADGIYGPRTEAALKIFEAVVLSQNRNPNWRNFEINITQNKLNILRSQSEVGCRSGAKNYLERSLAETRVADLATRLNVAGGAGFNALRTAISNYRTQNGLDNNPGGMFADQLTPEMYGKLFQASR